MANTDGLIHDENYFDTSYEKVDVTQQSYSKEVQDGLYKFTGDFNLDNNTELVRYTLYDEAPKEGVYGQEQKTETVPVLRDGIDGRTVFELTLYKRGSSIPSKPSSNLTWNFDLKSFVDDITGLNGWSTNIPALNNDNEDNNHLYVIKAVASSNYITDIIEPEDWSTPVEFSENLKYAQITLYRRSKTVLSDIDVPSKVLTWDFIECKFVESDLDGWSLDIPTGDSIPCYATSCMAVSNSSTDEIESGEWSGVALVFTKGEKGDTGNSILKVEKKSSTGLVDTYEILYSDGSRTTYNIKNGNGVHTVTETYGSTETASKPSASDIEEADITKVTFDSTNKYLWNKTVTTYTDGTVSDPVIQLIAVYGETGNTGVGIAKIEEYYATSTNTTKPATTKFSKTIPTLSATNKYLWNYTLITYDDSPTHTEGGYNDAVIIGAYGDSVSVSKTEIRYSVSGSGTTPPESNWNADIPTVQDKQYLWTRTYVEYTDKKTTTTYSVSYKSSDGNNGKLYSLKPSVTVVKIDKIGSYSVSTITCQKMLTNGDTTSVTADGTLKMSIDGGNEQNYASITLSTKKPTKTIIYNLYNSSNVLISSYTVPVYAETLTTEVQEIVDDKIKEQLPDAVQDEVEKQLEDFETQLPDSIATYTPKYLGEYSSLDSVPARNKKDYVLVKDGNEHKVYKWDGASWGEVKYSTEDRYMFEGCAGDCLKYAEESGEIAKFAVGYIANIFSNYIKVNGAVYGGKYNKNGDIDPQSTKDKGFYLGAEGNLKCVNGQFEGTIKSEGYLDIDHNLSKISYIKYKGHYGRNNSHDERESEYYDSVEEIPETLSKDGYEWDLIAKMCLFYDNKDNLLVYFSDRDLDRRARTYYQGYLYLSNTNEKPVDSQFMRWTGNTLQLDKYYVSVKHNENYWHFRTIDSNGYILNPDGSANMFGNLLIGENAVFRGDIVTDVIQLSSNDVIKQSVVLKANDDLLESILGEHTGFDEIKTYDGKGIYGEYTFDKIRLRFIDMRPNETCTMYLYNNGQLIYEEEYLTVNSQVYIGLILKWDFTFRIYQKDTKTFRLFNLPTDVPFEIGTVYIDKDTGNLKIVQ